MAWRNDYRNIVIAFDDIASVVVERFEIPLAILQTRRRDTKVVYARWFIIDFAHRFTHMSTAEIGWKLNKDPTTCLYANTQLPQHLDNDSELLYLYNTITQELEEEYYGI